MSFKMAKLYAEYEYLCNCEIAQELCPAPGVFSCFGRRFQGAAQLFPKDRRKGGGTHRQLFL